MNKLKPTLKKTLEAMGDRVSHSTTTLNREAVLLKNLRFAPVFQQNSFPVQLVVNVKKREEDGVLRESKYAYLTMYFSI